MTTEYLREFVTLAEIGNYAAAAEPLFISEATLSRHIMALEKELGAELFRRFPRRIELTEAGMVFLPYARQIVGAEDSYSQALTRHREFEKRSLAIGVDKALSFYHTAELIASFQQHYPEFALQLMEEDTFALTELVVSGQLQLAFVLDDPSHRSVDLKYKTFKNDHFAAAMASSHPLARQKSLHLSKLSGEKLLIPPQFTAMHEQCAKVLRQAGLDIPSAVYAELSGQTAQELVRCGLCTAIVPRALAESWDTSAVSICDIVPAAELSTAVIYASRDLSRSARLFLELLEEVNAP